MVEARATAANEDTNRPVGLSTPFTLEVFQEDIANIYLHYVRNIVWMTDEETGRRILGRPNSDLLLPLCSPEYEAADFGLTYEAIRHTAFAQALTQQYEFAYHGIIDGSDDSFTDESIHTWTAGLVVDVCSSAVATEWSAYGLNVGTRALRCAQVSETANARTMLEGGECFFQFQHFQSTKEDHLYDEGVLTVRQLALLAGMEELSIRAAANPKRANPLKTITADRRTSIEISVAKEWLQAKGRYVPITRIWSAGQLDLAKRRFEYFHDLTFALDARLKMVCEERGHEEPASTLRAAGIKIGCGMPGPFLDLEPEDYRNDNVVRAIARVLELPEDLLVLRVKETQAKENLRAIEISIKESVRNTK